ncbi:MAG: hypothetical protein R3C28_15645 [Pirellulaceae bacterium]
MTILCCVAGTDWSTRSFAGEPKIIPVTEASAQIGKGEVQIRMVVQQAKDRMEKRGVVYLDSHKDFNSLDNLGVALSSTVANELKEVLAVSDLAAFLKGKTIVVTGPIMKLETRIYLPVLSMKQIEIESRETSIPESD